MSKILPQSYNPKDHEEEIYRTWEQSGFFNPDKLPKRHKKPFTIIMPPPNANGALHIGHAVFVTLQDIMIRVKRMQGRRALWLPGADHAGFETQVVFDKKLEKEGRNRFAIPHDELYKEMLLFTLENKQLMEHQLRRLGASADWSRERFTLDPGVIRTTQQTFVEMHKDGLIYRGDRIVNWCPKHLTSLSELEIADEERAEPLYFLTYGQFTIATARPETKFGDKYVVVHPNDKRYEKYRDGEQFDLEWINGTITATLVKDKAIDPEFGTGAMTITPWHDPVDFEIAERHALQKEQIINEQGRLLPVAGEFAGMKIGEARPKIVEKLQQKGLLAKVDQTYRHAVRVCYKCKTLIEPQVRPQWFVRMTALPNVHAKGLTRRPAGKSLRDLAVDAVKSGKITFIPKRFEKIFFHWMKNLRDWNISRQIAWGIRIPAWKCGCDQGEFIIAETVPKQPCAKCRKPHEQDPDVLDTWFSSGQWPYATLGFPNEKDFKRFYPTDVMETGWDILFFWVSRMIMFGLYRTKEPPFHTVYLHGLVRDKDRQKMSKSKGNVIDPLGVAEVYGTDALRMALVVGNLPGNDIVISEEKIRGYRNFVTKLWNIQRYILMNYDKKLARIRPKPNAADRKRLQELQNMTRKVTDHCDKYQFHHAAETIYHYTWHAFADTIIESTKERFQSGSASERAAAQRLLLEIQSTILKLLHPFMPFVTEALWAALPIKKTRTAKGLLMIEEWPD